MRPLDEDLNGYTNNAWDSDRPVLIIVTGDDERREWRANFNQGRGNWIELSIDSGTTLFAAVMPLLDGFDDVSVYCESETIFTDAVSSWPPGQANQIKRMIREGDCQLGSSLGSADEQKLAEDVLEALDNDDRTIAVVSVLGTSLAYGGCNFKVIDGPGLSPFKTVRPLAQFTTLVVPQLVARCGLRKVAGADQVSRDHLALALAGTPYSSMLVTVADPNHARSTRREACRAALSA